jgi:hypothetical protein
VVFIRSTVPLTLMVAPLIVYDMSSLAVSRGPALRKV